MEEPVHTSAALAQPMRAWADFLSEDMTEEKPFEGTSLDIAVALRSVAAAQTWASGRTLIPVSQFMSALGVDRGSAEVLRPTVVQAESKESGVDPAKLNFAPFKSKHLRIVPLYPDHCQRAAQDLPSDSEVLVPEPITSQHLLPLQGLRFKARGQVTDPPPSPPPACFHRDSLTTYWQDLDQVKECGVLATLSPREVHRQEAMFEVVRSEASYLKSLGVAVDHFLASETLGRTVSPLEHHVLFSNLRQVMSASESFLQALECLLGECAVMSRLGNLVFQHCPRFQALYVPYLSNMMFQEALVNRLLQENKGFVSALKTLERAPLCQRQSLKSFLALPFQRITRLKLLMENVLRLTEPHTDSCLDLKRAIEALHKVIMQCNEGVLRMKQIEELVSLEMLLDFRDVKLLPMIVKGRFLLREGPLRQLTEVGSDSRIPFVDIHLHLFNDLLVISAQKEQRFGVLDHASFPGSVRVGPVNAGVLGLPADSFLLHLSQNQAGQATALILAAPSRSDKVSWMKVLSAES